MLIQDNKLVGVKYTPAKKIGSEIKPIFLVMHYTAGYTAESAIATFRNTEIAAHLVIDQKGEITQMVPFNRKANHAGPSKWQGVSMLNGHAIGIEFVNIGWAKMQNDGRLVDAYGKTIPAKDAATYIEAPNKRVGSGRIFWCPYPAAQIEAGVEVTKAILDRYDIRDIVSHEEIDTRGWKTDPGPAFPMNRFTSLMRGTPAGDPEPLVDNDPKGEVVVVISDLLNVRSGPGTNNKIIAQSKKGVRLGVIKRSSDGLWVNIHTATGDDGWVSAAYVAKE